MEWAADRQLMLERLYALVRQLRPLDRQIMLLYLEDIDATTVGEITGPSAGNIATKISRIKKILGLRAKQGAPHD